MPQGERRWATRGVCLAIGLAPFLPAGAGRGPPRGTSGALPGALPGELAVSGVPSQRLATRGASARPSQHAHALDGAFSDGGIVCCWHGVVPGTQPMQPWEEVRGAGGHKDR